MHMPTIRSAAAGTDRDIELRRQGACKRAIGDDYRPSMPSGARIENEGGSLPQWSEAGGRNERARRRTECESSRMYVPQ